MRDVSIKVEPLSTRPNAAIIAIGAVCFDRLTGKLGEEFYATVTFDSAVKAGHVDGWTLQEWLAQGERTLSLLYDDGKKEPLSVALDRFNTWLRGLPGGGGTEYVWGNGATADITWLESAYINGCVGLRQDWHYRNVRDMRTIVDAAQVVDPAFVLPASTGTEHHALDDARNQARAIAAAFAVLRGAAGGKRQPYTRTITTNITTTADEDPI